MLPACSSGTLTNVLQYRNAMPETQDMSPHTVTAYRHRTDLSLYYPLMWNVTLELRNYPFKCIGSDPSSYPQPPNLCTEAVIDRAMRTWILAH